MTDADRDPTGRYGATDNKFLIDLRKLILNYSHDIELLTIVADKDLTGKWVVQPVSQQERFALYKEKQDARRKAEGTQVQAARQVLKAANANARLPLARAATASNQHRRNGRAYPEETWYDSSCG